MLGLCDTGKKEEIIQRMKVLKAVTTEADVEETSVEVEGKKRQPSKKLLCKNNLLKNQHSQKSNWTNSQSQ